jgi:hypothetical protein
MRGSEGRLCNPVGVRRPVWRPVWCPRVALAPDGAALTLGFDCVTPFGVKTGLSPVSCPRVALAPDGEALTLGFEGVTPLG